MWVAICAAAVGGLGHINCLKACSRNNVQWSYLPTPAAWPMSPVTPSHYDASWFYLLKSCGNRLLLWFRTETKSPSTCFSHVFMCLLQTCNLGDSRLTDGTNMVTCHFPENSGSYLFISTESKRSQTSGSCVILVRRLELLFLIRASLYYYSSLFEHLDNRHK